MSVLLKRWIAYLLVPAGLVLLFFPLNTQHSEAIDKDFVFLKVDETLVDKTVKGISLKPPVNPNMEDLAQYIEAQQKALNNDFSTVATIINPYGYPLIKKQDLTLYPFLAEQVEDMMQTISQWRQDRIGSRRLDNVPMLEWLDFNKAFLGDTEVATFQYGNRIFKGFVKSDHVNIKVEIKHLKSVLKSVGGTFLILSFLAFRRLYEPPTDGIQIGKRLWMVVWDVIVIAIGVFFLSGFIDSMLVKYFQNVPFWGDKEMAFFMGIFWVTFGVLIMALFVTATALQTIWITAEGIALKGLFSRKYIAWPAVETIHLAEFFYARRIHSFYAPRKVAKILEIRGSSLTLRIMEPPVSSTKKEILLLLTRFAPQKLKGSLADVSSKWLPVW